MILWLFIIIMITIIIIIIFVIPTGNCDDICGYNLAFNFDYILSRTICLASCLCMLRIIETLWS